MSLFSKHTRIIYYDLETTGLDYNTDEIISIGAIFGYNAKINYNINGRFMTENYYSTFHKYLIPTCKITHGAYEIHGIKKYNNELYLHEHLLDNSVFPKKGLEEFMQWLETCLLHDSKCDEIAHVILVAHNNKKFDSVVLKKNMKRFGVNFPGRQTLKFVDSLDIMKEYKKWNNFYLIEGTAPWGPVTEEIDSLSLDSCLKFLCGRIQGVSSLSVQSILKTEIKALKN